MFPFYQDSGHQKGYEQFDTALMGLLRRILDTNKRVQEAACSAFATLEEVINLLHDLLYFRLNSYRFQQLFYLFAGSC